MESIDHLGYIAAVARAEAAVGSERDSPPVATPAEIKRACLVIATGGALVVAAIGVRGDFPLSDDWSYAFAVRDLCTEGRLRFLPWTGASLLLQAWYGALLCWLFGFSFTLLRASTVLVATTGVVGFWLLLREVGVERRAAAVGTVLFALNPLYVNLAFTFMTDVPCTAAAVWAGYFYARGLRSRRAGPLVAGALASSAALLIRQQAILVPAAAALAALVAGERRRDERLRDAIIVALVPAITFAAFHVWLFAVHGTPGGYANKLGEANQLVLAGLANSAFRGLAYLGLFLCPLAAALARPLASRHPGLLATWCGALTVAAVALYVRERALMPYLTNVLYDLGLGALTLRDTLFLGFPPPLHLGASFEVPLTIVATLAAGSLLAAWTAGLARLRSPLPAFLLLALALLFGGTLLHGRYYFDRYLVLVIPFALAATLAVCPVQLTRPLPLALSAVLAWFAVAGTHDYLAWNRARFAGLAALTSAGVPPSSIDGGFEFNAWHLASQLNRWPTDAEVRSGQPAFRKSWWWVVDDRFIVSFRPLAGYAIKDDLPFPSWIGAATGHVLVLERQP